MLLISAIQNLFLYKHKNFIISGCNHCDDWAGDVLLEFIIQFGLSYRAFQSVNMNCKFFGFVLLMVLCLSVSPNIVSGAGGESKLYAQSKHKK